MKHVVILAHPNPTSFNASVAEAYVLAATALGHRVLVRDLYALGFDPCLNAIELPFAENFEPGADVRGERALLADADVYALVYPLWLNAPPAILKGYLERVFGWGFAYGKDGHGSEPLLTGKRLISFSSSGAPLHWVEESGAMQAIRALFDSHFAAVCGLTAVDHIHFGHIVSGIRADAVLKMLDEVGKSVRKHFGRLQ
ncbi:MAG TPA: NAD(P)H-dependent oxidoreductase [Rhizomicrobium sp.]|nr:NAD(P)H-dependent oxidoreductase [Rhizomicrobium sp.]